MRRWQIGVLVLVSILVCLLYYFPILHSGNNLWIQDWDQNFAWTEASRVSLLDFHQFPMWNPYKYGGTVQVANPLLANRMDSSAGSIFLEFNSFLYYFSCWH